MTDAVLTFGSLDLLDSDGLGIHAYGDGFDLGAPEPLLTALPRLLLDGEVVSGSRSSNRELRFTVEISGPDALALAEAEAELVREVEKPRNVLTWQPPGGVAPASVFDTFRGQVRQVFDDRGEIHTRRVFEVTLPALPHARSADAVTLSLTMGQRSLSTTDLLAWTAGLNDTLSVDGDTLRIDTTQGAAEGSNVRRTLSAIHNDPIRFDVGRYVSVAVQNDASLNQVRADWTGAGYTLPTASQAEAARPGFTRHWWGPFAAGSAESFRVNVELVYPSTSIPASSTTRIADLRVDDSTPSVGPQRRQYGILDIPGAVRAPGTVEIVGSAGLGNVQVIAMEPYVGFRPDLDIFYTSGGDARVVDAALVSGGYRFLTSPVVYDVPAVTIRSGAYAVVAHASASTADDATATVTASLMNAAKTETYATTQSVKVLPVGSGWQFLTLGVFHPPANVADNSSNVLRVSVNSASWMGVDEVWLVPLDAAVIQVEAGSATRLWIDAPSAEQPLGGVWVGSAADRSDARSAVGVLAGTASLPLTPPTTALHVVTTGVADADISAVLHPRWHTNAAS